MRHTAIMATVADHRCTPEFIRALHGEGLDAVRINSAHVTPESIQRMVAVIRSVDSGIKILMDTKGPEIRTADVVAPIGINAGDVVEIASSHCPCLPGRISVMVDNLHQFLSQGCHVLIDDGDLEFEVTHIDGTVVYAKALRSGELQSRKTVNVPGVEIPPLPAVSQRDHENICAARQVGIDMIAHSFVRSADDVAALRREIAGTDIKLYSKIECREAIANFEEILAASDGILVARGDLGTQIPIPEIPALQYSILRRCREVGKPSIVSTQILHSMIFAPSPTRAEVSDIALAVMEGADTLLLCGETAQGQYPSQCVATMRHTIESIESHSLRCKID